MGYTRGRVLWLIAFAVGAVIAISLGLGYAVNLPHERADKASAAADIRRDQLDEDETTATSTPRTTTEVTLTATPEPETLEETETEPAEESDAVRLTEDPVGTEYYPPKGGFRETTTVTVTKKVKVKVTVGWDGRERDRSTSEADSGSGEG